MFLQLLPSRNYATRSKVVHGTSSREINGRLYKMHEKLDEISLRVQRLSSVRVLTLVRYDAILMKIQIPTFR